MIARVVAWSSRHAWLVIALAIVVASAGELARRTLSRDAIPDVSSPQIVLVADWMGHGATEVADRVTRVLTRELDGTPGVSAIRGSSMTGMAYVDVIFDTQDALAAGRAAIADRVAHIRSQLPADARVQVGPVASATSWIFEYALVDPRRRQSAVVLRHLQDDVLRPALAALPGVEEVGSVGGGVQQLRVELEADKLRAASVAVSDVVNAVRGALASHAADAPEQLAHQPLSIPGRDGDSPRIADVGRVHVTDEMPLGVADFRGIQPAVGGIVIASRGADVPSLVAAVERVLDEQRARLPAGVELVVTYNRGDAAVDMWHTLLRSLAEEVAVVALVVLVFLGSARSALVITGTLAVVVLMTFAGLRMLGVPATVMSLGGIAIALGLAVDADVVALEACHHALAGLASSTSRAERRARILAAAGAFAPAILTALVIAALSFLPTFAFTGETGRLLRPLVIGKTLVIAAAAVVTLLLAPALRQRLLTGVATGRASALHDALVRAYRPFVRFALERPRLTLATAVLAVLSCIPIASQLGGEFLPRIDEGDLLFMPTTLPGASVDASATQLFQQDRILRMFPEVTSVFGKVGRADTATDPAPYTMAETVLRLAPRSRWPLVPRTRWYSSWAPSWLRAALGIAWPEQTRETEAELVAKLDRATRLPGWVNAWTAPARARMDMMATGVRTAVGVRVVAATPARLDTLGTQVRTLVTHLPGTRNAVFESLGGETRLTFEPDAGALAQFHVDPALARAIADLVIAGGQVGDVDKDGERMRVRVVPDVDMPAMTPTSEPLRGPADQLRATTVRAIDGGPPVPLALLGRVGYASEPSLLRSEHGERVAYVYVDLTAGADVSSYVVRARHAIATAIASGDLRLEPGERIEWTGQYELLAAGQHRLAWIVPIVALSMLALLYLQLRSWLEALIVLAAVPFALVGSVWTLYLLRYPVSAPVWVGLLSVIGLAMQTGVVMVVYIDAAFHRRLRTGLVRSRDDIIAAHAEGTILRVRPKVMTVVTMVASLSPLMWAHGVGADVMRRVAAPMIGGLATSAFLTLEVLPVLYTLWRQHQLRRSVQTGTPLELIVGKPPAWARGRDE
jgi:copper/silver efflux system protein